MLRYYLFVALGGALGASLRYFTYQWVERLSVLRLPVATLGVNCLGSLLAGLLFGFFTSKWDATAGPRLFFLTGMLGAYTTFSTFAVESMALLQEGAYHKFYINILLNIVGSIGLATVGWAIARMCLK